MESILKIKNTVAFLEENNPSALAELKKQYPGNTDILEGKEKYGAEDHADTESKQEALIAVSLKGLQGMLVKVTPYQEILRKRLARAKTFRLIASITAIFTSTVLAALIGSNTGSAPVKILFAVINLIASALPILASYLDTSKYGGSKNMSDYLSVVNATFAEAKTLERLLQKDQELHNWDADTISNIKKTDEIFAKLSDIEEQLK